MLSWAYPSSNPKEHLVRFSRFCTAHRRMFLLYNGLPLPSQNCPFPWENLDLHLIHSFLGPSEFSSQRVSRSVQPFFAGLTTVTDHATLACNNRPHLRLCVRSTALRPKNFLWRLVDHACGEYTYSAFCPPIASTHQSKILHGAILYKLTSSGRMTPGKNLSFDKEFFVFCSEFFCYRKRICWMSGLMDAEMTNWYQSVSQKINQSKNF